MHFLALHLIMHLLRITFEKLELISYENCSYSYMKSFCQVSELF